MIEQATCPHGRKIDNRPTALKNMTKCHCCGMKIAPAYRTLCAQCEDTETMTDTKITITPEEAAALYAQFNADSDVFLQECVDRDEQMPAHYGRVMIHALTLAIARERERLQLAFAEIRKKDEQIMRHYAEAAINAEKINAAREATERAALIAGKYSMKIAAKIRGEE